MKKTRNHRDKNDKKQKKQKTIKHRNKILVPNSTPLEVRKISNKIAHKVTKESYAPTINNELVTLKSIDREELLDCNINSAFKFEEPLQIGIPVSKYGKKCYNYYTKEAQHFLLNNLSADKHINPKKIIPPIQTQANCWFNAMFATFFISDKGRKFFHFLRQLMIEGKQSDGNAIPEKLRDAFALLNFAVDACLTGNEYAYKLNTNSIIHLLFKGIPDSYKQKYPYIVDIDEASNPILYYIGIINYLHNKSIQMLFLRDVNSKNWKDRLSESVHKMGHLPHIIVFEIYDEDAGEFNKKPTSFIVNKGEYKIDSAVIRDVSKQHFCSVITCEGKELGYDGMSFHRLAPLKWKKRLNSNTSWQFKGSTDYDGSSLEWNFTKSYQMLIYYRNQ